MTEAEWLSEGEPWGLITHLQIEQSVHRTKRGRRKLRLFGCGCCRRVWHHYEALEDLKKLIEVAESFADGSVSTAAIEPLLSRVRPSAVYGFDSCLASAARHVASAAVLEAGGRAAVAIQDVVAHSQSPASPHEHVRIAFTERALQVRLFHCIFGNPFRPVALDPAWRTATAVQLAQGIYDDRAFDRLPILADALQDAGCDHDDVLTHCRDTGPHARGCWVVDLILGKA